MSLHYKNSIERARPLLGTLVEIRSAANSEDVLHGAIDAAFDKIHAISESMSFQNAASELSYLNKNAIRSPTELSQPLARVIKAACVLANISGGVFDPVAAKVLLAQDAFSLTGNNPDDGDDACWHDIEWKNHRTVSFKKPLQLKLCGIAKGYAVDCAVATLRQHGVTQGTVNAGGDLRVFGAVQEPIEIRGENRHYLGSVALKNMALATSGLGGCSKGMVIDGVSKKMMPAKTISVIAPRAIWADALTKLATCNSSSITEGIFNRLNARWIDWARLTQAKDTNSAAFS